MRKCNSKPELIPITNKLIIAPRFACCQFQKKIYRRKMRNSRRNTENRKRAKQIERKTIRLPGREILEKEYKESKNDEKTQKGGAEKKNRTSKKID